MDAQYQKMIDYVVKTAEEKKAEQILVIDLDQRSIVADAMIIITAKNSIHCNSLANGLADACSKKHWDKNETDLYIPPKILGDPQSGWIILDLNAILVHILMPEQREHYKIDEQFKDYPQTQYY